MQTIGIVHETHNQTAVYRAYRGGRQASGVTAGQALDNLETALAQTSAGAPEHSALIILQRFQPDVFFNEEQRARLQTLVAKRRRYTAEGQPFPAVEEEELTALVKAEWEAAAARAAAVLKQTETTAV
jgi:hypothetical protein